MFHVGVDIRQSLARTEAVYAKSGRLPAKIPFLVDIRCSLQAGPLWHFRTVLGIQ